MDNPETKRRRFTPASDRHCAKLAERESRTSVAYHDEEVAKKLAERGKNISGEDLGNFAKALLEKDLIRPAKDARTRMQTVRAGLEAGRIVGTGAAEVHLHQHQAFPPVVQKMLLAKMRELESQNQATLPPVVEATPTPPDPIASEDRSHG